MLFFPYRDNNIRSDNTRNICKNVDIPKRKRDIGSFPQATVTRMKKRKSEIKASGNAGKCLERNSLPQIVSFTTHKPVGKGLFLIKGNTSRI